MKVAETPGKRSSISETAASDGAPNFTSGQDRERGRQFLFIAAILTIAYAWPLISLMIYAAGTDLHSHILLIPIVSGYLLWGQRKSVPPSQRDGLSRVCAIAIAGVAVAALAGALFFGLGQGVLSKNDFLALTTFSYVCFLVAGGFAFLGRFWMAKATFPAAFLIFMVPLPDQVVIWFEMGLMVASAEASDLLFALSGTPYLRDGQTFQLPGITLEVAQECSGIRSSWVLFITSILASHILLTKRWRRIALVAVVIPLGILRNGFRILVIGMLCVHISPDMIHSIIHKRGGPLFFALSLIPLFLFLWWLRRGDHQGQPPKSEEEAASGDRNSGAGL